MTDSIPAHLFGPAARKTFASMCLTVGSNFKSPVCLHDERNYFSDYSVQVCGLTVEIELTHNLVLYCTCVSSCDLSSTFISLL